MTGFLLDTNFIFEIVRLQPDPAVMRWIDTADELQLHLSVLAIGEIRKGATLLPVSNKRKQLERWLEVDLPARFQDRILPIGGKIADIWCSMSGQSRMKGIALAVVDGLIAATAIHHGLDLVTRNVRDFAAWGVPVVNPWETG